jgi:hypothetical protein
MKRILLSAAVALVVLIAQAAGAIALVNSSSAIDSSGGFAATLAAPAINASAGNLIAVYTHCEQNTVGSITDTAGNTYTGLTAGTRGAGFPRGQWFYAKNIAGNAANVVTLHIAGGGGVSQFTGIAVLQFSGLDTAAPLDVDIAGGGFITSPVTSSAFTTSTANEVILMGVDWNINAGTLTAGTGYTIQESQLSASPSIAAQYKIVASVQVAVTASLSWTGGFATVDHGVASFKAAAAGATAVPRKHSGWIIQ